METPRTVLAAVGNNDYVLTTDEGRLLPDPNLSLLEISSLQSWGIGVPVQNPLFWPNNSSPGVHKSFHLSVDMGSRTGGLPPKIS